MVKSIHTTGINVTVMPLNFFKLKAFARLCDAIATYFEKKV